MVKNVHPKKPIKVLNNTHYFVPNQTRTYNTVQSSKTYAFRQAKIEGYESRLYWEFRNCQHHQGQCFYYTLTYNDKAMPIYEGKHCFDYKDLRYLLNGGFAKKLNRVYGTKLKYFVSAELGDGKGVRGFHNNPHYHVLFFLTPLQDELGNDILDGKYKPISPISFRNLVRHYWQGFDQDATSEFHDFRDAKFGIAKEGDNMGLVTDHRAVVYCAKYVCKDIELVKREDSIRKILTDRYSLSFKDSTDVLKSFWENYINVNYNKWLAKDEWLYQPSEIFYQYFRPSLKTWIVSDDLYDVVGYVKAVITIPKINVIYNSFVKELVDMQVTKDINEYRNRYCNKCRISQGVGDYGLDFVNRDTGKIPFPTKHGFKDRPINLYYYRKLFTDVCKDNTGKNIYILNDDGIKYKCSRLADRLDNLVNESLNLLVNLDESTFNDMINSPVNTDCYFTWTQVLNLKNNENKNEIAKRFASYKLVYADRFTEIETAGLRSIDVFSDYSVFLNSAFHKVDYALSPTSDFLEKSNQGYIPYISHPYFSDYSCFYPFFSLLTDYSFIKADDKKEDEARKIAEVRLFHKKLKINSFFKTLKI